MNTKLFKLSFFLLALLSFQASAAVVDDLYIVELPVADQTTLLRIDTFKKAFAQVLVKISGAQALLKDPALKRSLRNAKRYVKAFRYERQELAEDTVDENLVNLRVEFDQKQIDTLLRSKGYPVWGRVRPSILIVMAKKVNRKYELVSEESTPDLIEEMDSLSHQHGLPTQFPLLDLEDRTVLNNKESVLDNIDAINALGLRYQSDVVFVGELMGEDEKGWKGVWQSQFSGKLFQWKNKASTKAQILENTMAYLAKILAQEYALGSIKENANSVIIEVSNIATLDEYLLVGRYFSNLAVVEKTQVQLLSNDRVSFKLELRNSPEELQRLIGLGDVIEQVDLPVINTSLEESGDTLTPEALKLTYRLLK